MCADLKSIIFQTLTKLKLNLAVLIRAPTSLLFASDSGEFKSPFDVKKHFQIAQKWIGLACLEVSPFFFTPSISSIYLNKYVFKYFVLYDSN